MPTPPASSATVDLTESGSFGSVDGAVFSANVLQAAGSGNFGTFVRISAHGTEQGYNSDFRPVQFNESDSLTHNHALLLASVPIIEGDGTDGTIEGVLYREFLLDANELNGQSRELLSLDALEIYQAEVGNLTGFHQPVQQGGDGTGFGTNATLVYDLDAGSDSWIALNAVLGSGGGQSDMRILIPDALFDQNTPYVLLYSAFGYQDASWNTDGGSEEWGTRGPQGNVPALNIAMTGTVPGGTADAVGEVITYAITVRNMGNVSLTGVTVADPFAPDVARGADLIGNNDDVLNVGEIWSYTAHHTVTQAEIDGTGEGGLLVNTATADSNQTGPDSATVATVVETATQLEFVKLPDVASVDAAGDVINYTITLENTGSTTLTNPLVNEQVEVPFLDLNAPVVNLNAGLFFAVNDGDFNLGDTNQNNVQDPGETFQYVYIGDFDMNGFHDPGETWVAFNLGDTDVDGIHDAGEVWVGDTNQNGIEEAGERWQFQNLGDANQNGLQDPGETRTYINLGDDNLNGVEDPGETFRFRNIGDTDQDGVEDAGETFQFYNVGDTNQNGTEDAGETFQFTTVFHPLPDVDADNNGFNDGDSNTNGIVDPGETWRYQAPAHTVTQAEIDNGGVFDPDLSIDNTAGATTDQTSPVTATASVDVVQDPEVTLTNAAIGGTYNDANLNGRPDAGETISYAFTVTNSGNMTLHGIVVSDPDVTVSGAAIASLAPGFSNGATFTGSYAITQDDIDAGFFTNMSTADAAAGAPGGFAVSDDDDETVTLPQDPSLTVDNTGTWVDGDSDGFADVGERIDYVITVHNDGNVTLHDVEVNDTLLGSPLSGPASGDADSDGLLDVGETWTYEASYLITQDDIDAGTVHNEATADALGPQDQPASDSDDNDAALPQDPSLTIDNTGAWEDGPDGDGFADVGEFVNYVITVTNDGNVTLHDVEVNDTLLGVLSTPSGDDGDGLLDVGETWTYEASYAITQADIDAGTVHNEATADALGPQNQPASASDDNDAALPQNPHVTVTDTATIPDADGDGKIDSPADDISHTITVVNDGNVTLHNVVVSDTLFGPVSGPAGGDADSDGALDVGETWTYGFVYDVDQDDIDNRGSVDGTADDNIHNVVTVATDEAPDGTASEDVAIDYRASMNLAKIGVWNDDGDGIAEEGETITYTFEITNTGNATLHESASPTRMATCSCSARRSPRLPRARSTIPPGAPPTRSPTSTSPPAFSTIQRRRAATRRPTPASRTWCCRAVAVGPRWLNRRRTTKRWRWRRTTCSISAPAGAHDGRPYARPADVGCGG